MTQDKTAPASVRGPVDDLEIAVLIPCYNEAAAIAKVVNDFRQALPGATVYVYDNNSTDGTAETARAAGAVVRHEPRQGKGFVVRRMFADIDAEIFIMVDGDDTYDAAAAPRLVAELVENGLDVVNAVRREVAKGAYRPGHEFGNRLLSGIVGVVFGDGASDMLSGYRVFSRRFVKSFPMMSRGFEIEAELTIHALELEMPTAEVATAFRERPPGSQSKLHSVRDGFRILFTIIKLLKQERPLEFFGVFGLLLGLLSLGLAYPVVLEYYETGLVPRFPTAILSASIMLLAFLSFACGLILDTVTRGRQEAKRMRYLAEAGILSRLADPTSARRQPLPRIRGSRKAA